MTEAQSQPAPKPKLRWFNPTPGRFVLLLLAVEFLLWLLDRFGWLGWHKGYAVLGGVAVVCVAMVLMLVWFGVALVFGWRFQFSVRSLLVLVVVVALRFSWLAVEIKKARQQKAAVEAIRAANGDIVYDWNDSELQKPWECFADSSIIASLERQPTAPAWLAKQMGADFFYDIVEVYFPADFSTAERCDDSTLDILRCLTKLKHVMLTMTNVTDAGVAKLQKALPHCKIIR